MKNKGVLERLTGIEESVDKAKFKDGGGIIKFMFR